MALTEETLMIKFDVEQERKTVSIAHVTIIKRDGEEISRTKLHRRAFAPGDIEEVKTYLELETSPEIEYLNSLWTEEVVAQYQAHLAAQEEE